MNRRGQSGRSIFGLLSVLLTVALAVYVGVQLQGMFKGGGLGKNIAQTARDRANEIRAKADERAAEISRQIASVRPASNPATGPGPAQTKFTVILKHPGGNKPAVIREVRAITGLGLAEAASLVESTPKEIGKDISRQDAERMKERLEEAGATAEIK